METPRKFITAKLYMLKTIICFIAMQTYKELRANCVDDQSRPLW